LSGVRMSLMRNVEGGISFGGVERARLGRSFFVGIGYIFYHRNTRTQRWLMIHRTTGLSAFVATVARCTMRSMLTA
jgi:hypothetical protein